MTTAAPPPRLPYAREGQVIVSPDATPPAEDLLDLLEMEPKFRQSWGRQRPDFKEQNSHNYELSLASIALSYSWSDQAITDLLIAWRRRHQRTFQPRSAHYYQLLKAARANEEQNSIHDELPELLKSASPDRDSLLQNRLSRLLRLKIRSVARYPGPPETYAFNSDQGYVRLGRREEWQTQGQFADLVFHQTGQRPRGCLEPHWQLRQQAFLALAKEIAAAAPDHPQDRAISWLDGYLRAHPPNHQWPPALAAAAPLVKDGSVHIRSKSLRDWLQAQEGLEMTPHAMGRRLRRLGARPRPLTPPAAEGPGGAMQYWRLPDALFPAPLPPAFKDHPTEG